MGSENLSEKLRNFGRVRNKKQSIEINVKSLVLRRTVNGQINLANLRESPFESPATSYTPSTAQSTAQPPRK
jgi:hypothetical protein